MNTFSHICALVLVLVALAVSNAFAPPTAKTIRPAAIMTNKFSDNIVILMAEGDNDTEEGGEPAQKLSLEEKMKSWEASEEELKAASLGGITAGSKGGADGFDIGLWIMFPFIVATSLLFFVFPFIMDKIDVSSVGPPPMV